MEVAQVYKVVENRFGVLTSYMGVKRAQVVYKPGEWVEAPGWLAEKGYHITAYRDMRCAEEDMRAAPNQELWLAEAEGILEQLPPSCQPNLLAEGILEPNVFPTWPPDTIMCRRLKLIRRLARSARVFLAAHTSYPLQGHITLEGDRAISLEGSGYNLTARYPSREARDNALLTILKMARDGKVMWFPYFPAQVVQPHLVEVRLDKKK